MSQNFAFSIPLPFCLVNTVSIDNTDKNNSVGTADKTRGVGNQLPEFLIFNH